MKDKLCIFYVSSLTQFRELFGFAKVLCSKGRGKPVFWIAVNDPNSPLPTWSIEVVDQLSQENIEYRVVCSSVVVHKYNRIIGRVLGLLWLQALQNTYKYALSLLSEQNVASFIIGEDGVGGPLPYIKAAKKLGIKVVTIPYEFSLPEQAIMAIESSSSIDQFKINSLAKRFTKLLFPHWSFKPDNQSAREYLRLPLEMVWSTILAGMDLENPWLVHGGNSDIVLSESEAMSDIYLKLGMLEKKIVLVNSPRYISLARYILSDNPTLEAFRNSTYITTKEPKLLIALPPSYFENKKLTHMFEGYDELLDFLSTMAKEAGLKSVTLQLHPGVQPDVRMVIDEFVKNNPTFTLSENDLAKLIVNHDIFMTCASSTIRWAIAAKKPVINIDIFGFNFPDYDNVVGVLKSSDPREIVEHLRKLVSSEAFYTKYIEQSDFRKWGALKNADMTLDELESINTVFEDKVVGLLYDSKLDLS